MMPKEVGGIKCTQHNIWQLQRYRPSCKNPGTARCRGFCFRTAAVPDARRSSTCAAVAAVLRPGSREDQRALKALTLANSLASLRSAGV